MEAADLNLKLLSSSIRFQMMRMIVMKTRIKILYNDCDNDDDNNHAGDGNDDDDDDDDGDGEDETNDYGLRQRGHRTVPDPCK